MAPNPALHDDEARARLERQARALGTPTRHAIFRAVCDAGDAGVGVAALTERFGLNHNAIRQHLAKLCDAQLVVESLAPARGPGRRPLLYRAHASANGMWEGPNPYEELSTLLLRVLRTGNEPRAVGYEAGFAAAKPRGERRSRPFSEAEALDRLESLIAQRGFEPKRVERDGRVTLVLQQCPYASAATSDAATVCGLHLGLAEGMVDGVDCDYEVERLVARKPHHAGCRIELRPRD